jgi:hypothetical protein
MTYAECEIEIREAHEEFKRLGGYENPEACARHKRRHEMLNRTHEFRAFTDKVADRVIEEQGFKLSPAQRTVVAQLVQYMVEVKLGRDWMLNHYEFHRCPDRTVNWCFAYYDKGQYFLRMNTRTLEKLEKIGVFKTLEVGGKYSDTVVPCFDFDLIEKF